jgi:hypothetical protein
MPTGRSHRLRFSKKDPNEIASPVEQLSFLAFVLAALVAISASAAPQSGKQTLDFTAPPRSGSKKAPTR